MTRKGTRNLKLTLHGLITKKAMLTVMHPSKASLPEN